MNCPYIRRNTKQARLPTRAERRHMLLPRIIGYFKMNSAKRINRLRNSPGTPVWQRSYHEHVIRSEAELTDTREYIQNNPLQWELDKENPITRRGQFMNCPF